MSNSNDDDWHLNSSLSTTTDMQYKNEGKATHLEETEQQLWSPVQVLRMMQWSMMGLQLTVISRQWWALWCWADLSSGLNCNRNPLHTSHAYYHLSKNGCNNSCVFRCMKERTYRNFILGPLTFLTYEETHLYCHISYIRVLWPLHEHKRWISSVLDYDFIRYLPRSCEIRCTINILVIQEKISAFDRKHSTVSGMKDLQRCAFIKNDNKNIYNVTKYFFLWIFYSLNRILKMFPQKYEAAQTVFKTDNDK